MSQQHFKITTQNICSRFKLPKIAAKRIEEANCSTGRQTLAANQALSARYQNYESSRSNHYKKQKSKNKRTTTLKSENLLTSYLIIQNQLKKFRPINGSFSEHYGQQLSLSENKYAKSTHSNCHTHRQPNQSSVPQIQRKSKHAKNSRSTQLASCKTHKQQTTFLEKLDSIRKNSELLKKSSKILTKKANCVLAFNENRFSRLEKHSKRIVSGEEFGYVDEELVNAYKENKLNGHLRWVSKM